MANVTDMLPGAPQKDANFDDVTVPPAEDVDKRQPKDHQKSKGNQDKANTERVRVHQGRWRTVATKKEPRSELRNQEGDEHVEHRPLGF